jgi:hypothetical protein
MVADSLNLFGGGLHLHHDEHRWILTISLEQNQSYRIVFGSSQGRRSLLVTST